MQSLVGTEVFAQQRRAALSTPTEELQLPPRTTGTEMLRMVSGKCVKVFGPTGGHQKRGEKCEMMS